MEPHLTNGKELIHEEPVKSCCHSETNGVENVAFEAVAVTLSEPHHVHNHNHSHNEEIGLEGMNYKPLCSCDETGDPCKCGRIQEVKVDRFGMREIRTQPWGKWKCIALSIILALTGAWVIVFVTLLVEGVI